MIFLPGRGNFDYKCLLMLRGVFMLVRTINLLVIVGVAFVNRCQIMFGKLVVKFDPGFWNWSSEIAFHDSQNNIS